MPPSPCFSGDRHLQDGPEEDHLDLGMEIFGILAKGGVVACDGHVSPPSRMSNPLVRDRMFSSDRDKDVDMSVALQASASVL